MHWLDMLIVAAIFVFLGWVAYYTKRYTRGVADFLAANRCAGRYLLTLADGMAGLGAIGIIGSFQQYYEAGFASNWWGNIMAPIGLFLTLSGFIAYRFRESRVMTIAQFYEMRYSRKFRIFAGVLAWISGVINYGVFPSVTARFFIYFCGIPRYTVALGNFELDLTLGLVMGVLLSVAITVTLRGGQIAIMVTDFLQAQYVNVVFLVLMVVLLVQFGWGDIVSVLKEAPEGKSMLNPFDQSEIPSFNVLFFAMGAFNLIYTHKAWQGNQGYYVSAKTPHDAKMAGILAMWRFGVTWTVIGLIPVCAYVFLQSDLMAGRAAEAQAAISQLGDVGLERQLTVPLALREMLPVGVFGLFVAAMLAAAVSTDDTYLHSWGSIFIQDVLLPFTGKELTPEQHLRWLRRSIVGVAIFAWVFGMLFPLQEYIFMYWAITGAIYTGGAGAVIIGGFYWKRGTTEGAWAGMITGSILAFSGITVNNVVWPYLVPALKNDYPNSLWIQDLPEVFWLDGMQLFVGSALIACSAYILVSLFTKPKPGFELDKLLNRGKYAVAGEHETASQKKKQGFWAIVGVTHEYSPFDKFLAAFLFCWTLLWFAVFVVGTAYALGTETTEDQWANWWLFQLVLAGVIGTVTIIWFLIGGFRDLFDMFRILGQAKRDAADDGLIHDKPESA